MCRGAVCAPGIGVTVIVALSVFKKGAWKSKIVVWLSPGCKTRRLLIKFFALKLICRLRSGGTSSLAVPRGVRRFGCICRYCIVRSELLP